MSTYKVYMPAGVRKYNAYMPLNKRVYNVRLDCVSCQANLFPPGFSPPGWSADGSSVLTENAIKSPSCQIDGAECLVGPAIGDQITYLDTSFGTPNTIINFRIWMKKITASGDVDIVDQLAVGAKVWGIDLGLMGTDWEELTDSHIAVTAARQFETDPSGQFAISFRRDAEVSATRQFYLWCAFGEEV